MTVAQVSRRRQKSTSSLLRSFPLRPHFFRSPTHPLDFFLDAGDESKGNGARGDDSLEGFFFVVTVGWSVEGGGKKFSPEES